MTAHRLLSAGCMIVNLVVLGGCDNGPVRHKVSGTITFEKKPLKNGTITFYPESTGTQAGTVIADGKYLIPRDKGLLPGKYRVSISSPDGGEVGRRERHADDLTAFDE